MANVNIYNRQKDVIIGKEKAKGVVFSFLEHENISFEELSIYFVSKRAICSLHKKFFNDPTATDCISFPIDSKKNGRYDHLGEVFVCPKVAKEFALASSLSIEEEIYLYVIHGILHLIGYDDITSNDRAIMKKKEKTCMEFVKKLLNEKKENL